MSAPERHDDDRPELRELLESTAPERPDLDHASRMRAVRARSRSRSQRLRLALGGGLAAVVGVGAAVPLLAGGTGGVASDPAPVDPTPSVAVAVEPCPAQPVPVDGLGSVTLPADAAWFQACPGAGMGGLPLDLPADPIVLGAAELAGALGDLPAFEQLDPQCALMSIAQHPWTIRVGDPAGDVVTLGASTRACQSVSIDGVPRAVEDVLETYRAAAEAEAVATAADAPGPDLSCPTDPEMTPAPDTWTGRIDAFNPVVGLLCYRPDSDRAPTYANTSGELSPGALGTVVGDVRERITPASDPGPTQCDGSGPVRLLVLADTQGRTVTLSDRLCRNEFVGTGWFGRWAPDSAAEREISRALGGRID
jgi:hypothetical protein